MILIFLIWCTVFVVHCENFGSRFAISLTALLACIATQLAMSFDRPQIFSLTVIDRTFARGRAVSVAQAARRD